MSESSCSLVMNATHDKQLSCWPLGQTAISLGDQSQCSSPQLYCGQPSPYFNLSLFFLHHRILIWIYTPEMVQPHLCCNVWPREFTISLHVSVFGTRSKQKLNLAHSTCPSLKNHFGSPDQQCVIWITALFRAHRHGKLSVKTWKKRHNASFCSCLIYWSFSALGCVFLKLCRNKMK